MSTYLDEEDEEESIPDESKKKMMQNDAKKTNAAKKNQRASRYFILEILKTEGAKMFKFSNLRCNIFDYNREEIIFSLEMVLWNLHIRVSSNSQNWLILER